MLVATAWERSLEAAEAAQNQRWQQQRMRQRASERCQRRLRPGPGGRGGSRTQTRHDVAPKTKMTKRGHRVVINAFFLDMTLFP